MASFPYYLTLPLQTLDASGGAASASVQVPGDAKNFICQGINAVGLPASGTNRQSFTVKLIAAGNNLMNAAIPAFAFAGDGKNAGLTLNEFVLRAGENVSVDLANINGAVAYTNIAIVLFGRIEK